jgi:glucan biosynthesis protein C
MQIKLDSKKPKILYIENLRILLSVLVVVVHMACSYGGPGGWAYEEPGAGLGSILPLTILNATSQSFFMGMFFLFGAYFTHLSFQKKGAIRFVKDRFMRLGIPLMLTYYFISPLTRYIVWPIKHPEQVDFSFTELWTSGRAFGVGVMWFAEALIYFTILYMIARMFLPWLRRKEKLSLPKLTSRQIFLSSVLLGIVTFLVRLIFPLFTHNPTNFTLGHFPQYIFLFILGIVVARYDSDNLVSYRQAKKWMWFSLGMIVIVFPLIFFLGGARGGDIKPYFGGFTWHSLAFSLWEQITGIAIMVTLIGILKVKWNTENKLSQRLSGGAYAVYVFHPPIIVWISIQFMNWEAMHLVKFLILTPLALVASYGVAIAIKRIPVLRKIF